MFDNNRLPRVDLTRFIALAPNAPALYNEDGTLNWMPNEFGRSTWQNPLSYLNTTSQIKPRIYSVI